MHVGVLQIELLFPDALSLKDKRRVMKSLRDRLHRRHLCAVGEVGALGQLRRGVLGVSVVAGEAARCSSVLEAVMRLVSGVSEARVGEVSRRVMRIDAVGETEMDAYGRPIVDGGTGELDREMLERGLDAGVEVER